MVYLNASYEEIYLYAKQEHKFNAVFVYQELTHQHQRWVDLTEEKIHSFLNNIEQTEVLQTSIRNKTPPFDKPLSADDIFKLDIYRDPRTIFIPLGHTFNKVYPYTVDPFKVSEYEDILVQFNDEITTANKTILMHYGELKEQTLYLCLVEDVLAAATAAALEKAETIQVYYPYLHKENIVAFDSFEEKTKKAALLDKTSEMTTLNENFQKNNANINLFYENYKKMKTITDVGITAITLTLYPLISFNLPLDIVFKLIHATEKVPMIKYNPAKKQENIFRLYTGQNVAANGKKIPVLEKGNIFKWEKNMAKLRSVAVFLEHEDAESGSKTPLVCEFENNGNVTIRVEQFNKALTPAEVDALFAQEINPVIETIQEYLAQSGYTINKFVSIDAKNVEIANIDYVLHASLEKPLVLKNILGCASSVFNVISDNIAQEITMRFKRVANYNEMDSQEALIVDMSDPHLGFSDNDIMQKLQVNFRMSEDAARTKYAEVRREQQLLQGINRKIKTKKNPGFLTTITRNPLNKLLHTITVKGINHINYIDTLHVYIAALLYFTQHKEFKNICKSEKIADKFEVLDIIPEEMPADETSPVALNYGGPQTEADADAEQTEADAEAQAQTDTAIANVGEEIVFNEDEFNEDEFMAMYGQENIEEDLEDLEGGGSILINLSKRLVPNSLIYLL